MGRAASSATAPYGRESFVAPTGNGSNPGTKDLPFATLERARTAVRALRHSPRFPAGGVVVWLRGGICQRTATFILSAEDSCAAGKPVVYRSYPGEQARLLGGKVIDPTWFATVASSSSAWSRMDPTARGRLLQVDLAAHGITDYGKLSVRGFGSGTIGAVVSGTDNGLNGCEIYATCDAGVSLSGSVRASLTPGNNYVRNCDIHHFGRWSWTYQPAVRLSGAGHIVAHNLMHDVPAKGKTGHDPYNPSEDAGMYFLSPVSTAKLPNSTFVFPC